MLDAFITSKTRARLLELLLQDPGRRHYLRGLERELGESATPIRRELLRLERLGFLEAVDEANIRYYTVNVRSPLYAQLSTLTRSPRLSGAEMETVPAGSSPAAPSPVPAAPIVTESGRSPVRGLWLAGSLRTSRGPALLAVVTVGVMAVIVINLAGVLYVERRMARLQTTQELRSLTYPIGRHGPSGAGNDAIVRRVESDRPSQQQAAYIETSSPRFRVVPGTW